MSKKVTIQVSNTPSSQQEPVVTISEAYAKRWKLPDKIIVHFGAYKHTALVSKVPKLEGVRISADLAQATGLWTGDSVRMQYRPKSRVLQLGPLIGVLLRSTGKSSLFGTNTTFCKELSDASSLHGACVFFFTPSGISSSPGSIEGWVHRNGGWHKASFPMPDVVYNRITTRKIENKPSVQNFLREVKSGGGQVFNERFLDKTEVFQLLRGSAGVKSYLPESHAFQDFAMLKSMCSKYPIVFLKPVRGSLGKGIIRIVRKSGGSYNCQYATVNGTKSQSYGSLQKLYQSISTKLKLSRYQIQQGLQLVAVGGRPMDFRALVQKNQSGKWSITSIVARIAGNQHFVSNLARGGTLSPVKEALIKSNLGSGKVGAVNARLRKASIAIAEGLERQIPEHFGEMGIDLAVSKSGRVWLLEVNSKPSKNDNTPLSEQKIRPSVKQLLLYCRYLSRL